MAGGPADAAGNGRWGETKVQMFGARRIEVAPVPAVPVMSRTACVPVDRSSH